MPMNMNLAALRSLRAMEENRYGYTARVLHLAYGLVRGRTIDQIESPNSNPYQFPDPKSIADKAAAYYRPINDGEDVAAYEVEKRAFHAKLITDLTAWKKQLYLNWLTIDATRRRRNTLKRSTPRIHPSPRPQAAQVM